MPNLDPNRSSLRDVQAYFHSQQSAPDHQKILSKNAAIAVEILKNKYTTEPCSKKELQVLEKIKADVHRLRGAAGESAALGDLETRVGSVLKKGVFTEHFQVKTSTFEKFVHYVQTKAGELVQSLSRAIRAEFYHAWKDKLQHEKDVKELPLLQNKADAASAKLKQLEAEKANIANLPEPLRAKAQAKVDESMHVVTAELREVKTKMRYTKDRIKAFAQNLEKAKSTRQQFVAIGGEHVTLSTADRVKLDGMYLSADTFREKLQQANVGVFSFNSAQLNEKNKVLASLSGLVVDQADFDRKDQKLFRALAELHLLSGPYDAGAGWTKIMLPQSNKVLFVDERDCQSLITSGVLKKEGNPVEYVLQDIGSNDALQMGSLPPQERTAGTVILGSGTKGVYEMQKRESLAFLLRGMNVMMVNYRGYGASEGEPSTKGTHLDIEAAYQYLKEKHPVQDEHIVAKGMCMSGGMMAKLAENHPRINLMLDQTYAEFHGIVSRSADTGIKQFLGYTTPANESRARTYLFRFLSSMVGAAARVVEPDYATLPGLKKAQGQICIMESRKDEFTPRGETIEMIETLRNEDKLTATKVISIPGTHGSSWLDAAEQQTSTGEVLEELNEDLPKQFVGRSQMDHFLSSVGLLQPILPRRPAK